MSRYLKKEDKFGKQNKRIISLTQKDKKIDRQIARQIDKKIDSTMDKIEDTSRINRQTADTKIDRKKDI